mmetsp:Transcript_51517/g.95299  ORF Transcript_51517/g.95299 Transcript_51517/m.95299 type:complete len:319 (-) Transcript_51517:29-985(-)
MAAEGVSQHPIEEEKKEEEKDEKDEKEEKDEQESAVRNEDGEPLSKRPKVTSTSLQKVDVFNGATACVFDPVPFASGHFRYVHVGKYTAGPRANQNCVVKIFKKGSVYEESFFQNDIKVVDEASCLITCFNDSQGKAVGKKIYLNRPEVWDQSSEGAGKGQKLLVEPMIEGQYYTFNSNTGYVAEGYEIMQALSHFSYHLSDGEMLLCDLQGGMEQNAFILTDPVILSRKAIFGPTDLGSKGIRNFMARHVCTRFCRPFWKKPVNAKACFPASRGTTFGTKTVGTKTAAVTTKGAITAARTTRGADPVTQVRTQARTD